ncbi:MAG TPA: DUF1580 domain-containing protein [Pirellulaceae bacterium]|nr:DUF1580 domain-containing protein [Pirellulaceae bacterium]
MAIDVFSEKVISLKEATRRLPRGPRNKRLNISTIYRWSIGGLRSRDGMVVRLETVKVGGTTCTSQEALQRFFDRLSGNLAVVTPPTRTMRQRELAIRRAEKYLESEGM